jgi:hypothetical protein
VWDEKLQETLGENIEQEDGNLKTWSSYFFTCPARFNHDLYQAKEEYYRLAGQLLNDYPFANEFEREVWRLHSEGVSIFTILAMFRAQKRYSSRTRGIFVYKRKIHETIQRLAKEMVTRNK